MQRARHIRKIQDGHECFYVLRWGRNDPKNRGHIGTYLLVGGKVHQDHEGTYWLEITGKQVL